MSAIRQFFGLFILIGALLLQLYAPPARANEPTLNTGEIARLLTGREVIFATGDRQRFEKNGVTIYYDPSVTEGKWTARDNQYCSLWAPSTVWVCYKIEAKQKGAGWDLVFIGYGGRRHKAVIAP